MTTTIKKKVKGRIMEAIFDQADIISVRYFERVGSSIDFNPEKVYSFTITIRHPEDSDATALFNAEVKKHKIPYHDTQN